jgi:hypothetical protein
MFTRSPPRDEYVNDKAQGVVDLVEGPMSPGREVPSGCPEPHAVTVALEKRQADAILEGGASIG